MCHGAEGDKTLPQDCHRGLVVLLEEPGSEYLGHVDPISGTSLGICKSIIEFCSKNAIDLEFVQAIGCDGTNVNTGVIGGVIRCLEKHLDKPLQWLVCLLHNNELPFISLSILMVNQWDQEATPDRLVKHYQIVKNCLSQILNLFSRIFQF